MNFGKRKLLAAFLEKDNVKLLVFDVSVGGKAVRSFAGQISFSGEVLRDAYIADPAKFSGQIKTAFAQKPNLTQTTEAILFIPSDKTFTKSLPIDDPIDGFIQSLPYFKEELVINKEGKGEKITHVAFEKKLVEDLQRPFLELGKTVTAVKSAIITLAINNIVQDRYFLLASFDKEIALAVCDKGVVQEISSFPIDVFSNRFAEYIVNHNLQSITNVYTLGVFDANLSAKMREEKGMEVVSLVNGDIYDLTVSASLKSSKTTPISRMLSLIEPLAKKIPKNRTIFLLGAIAIGFGLVFIVGKGLMSKPAKKEEVVSPKIETAPAPQVVIPKPADFKVRILNGTLVTGEAGKLKDKIKPLGFDVVETKNATTAGFVNTRLRTTIDVPGEIIDILKTNLLQTYLAITPEPLASSSSDIKIEIIIGKKK